MAIVPLGKLADYINPVKLALLQSTGNLLGAKNIEAVNAKIRKLAQGLQPIKMHSKAEAQQSVSLKVQGNYQATASVQSQKIGNTTYVQGQLNASGTTASQLNATLNQTQETKIKQGGTKPAQITQTLQLNQNRDVNSLSQFNLGKSINSTIVSNAYQKVGGYTRLTDIVTDTNQNLARQQNTNALTDTTRVVTNKDNKGNIIGESFSHRIVDEATQYAMNQNTLGHLERNITQDVSTSKAQVAGFAINKTEINTQDVRNSQTQIQTGAQTDYLATVTSLNKEGAIIGQSNTHRITDSQEARNIQSLEDINSQRTITSAVKGAERISIDTEKVQGALSQTTNANASTVVTNLNPEGNVISQQTYLTNTVSELNQTSNTDINRLIKQDAGGIRGAGELNSSVATNINTQIESTNPAGVVTQRNIERDIETQNNAAWAGSIELENTESGGRMYSLKNIDISKRAITDVTKEGVNELKINTDTVSAKMVAGNVNYQPAEQVTPVGNVAGAGVGISFATYTGIASGFKLDQGEVNFNFSFASAEYTDQEVTKTANGEVVSENATKSGQKTDAALTGKLTSVINEDGSRLIKVTASYQKDGEKLVVEGNKNPEFAKSEQDTNVELEGTILVSKNGDVKNVESSFDMFKTENTEAAGTGLAAVRKAMEQSDPLRKSFYFDNGNLRFNLGFATLNFAIYA